MTIFVRIRAHLLDRMHERLTEWEHSLFLMVLGIVLYIPPPMTALPNEHVWGVVLFVTGALRFGSLVVNGYRRMVTSWLRAICAALGGILFMLISAGYIYAGKWEASGLFLVVAVFELFNLGRSARDAGRSYAARLTA